MQLNGEKARRCRNYFREPLTPTKAIPCKVKLEVFGRRNVSLR